MSRRRSCWNGGVIKIAGRAWGEEGKGTEGPVAGVGDSLLPFPCGLAGGDGVVTPPIPVRIHACTTAEWGSILLARRGRSKSALS